MIDLDRLAQHALSLEGVRERRGARGRGWFYDGRLVARQEDRESVVVRCGFVAREALVDEYPETFSVPPRLESHQKVLVDLVRGRPDAALAAVTGAWELQRSAR